NSVHRANDRIFLYAFDLIELNGDDMRRDPLEVRKATLASIVAKASPGIRFNEHMEGDGPTVPVHSCRRSIFQANGRHRTPHDGYRGRSVSNNTLSARGSMPMARSPRASARRRFRALEAEAVRVGSLRARVGHGYQLLRLTVEGKRTVRTRANMGGKRAGGRAARTT